MFYFTADEHYGSQRTLELSKRPFHSVYEMNEAIITNHNKIVSDYDTVIHVGDFGNYDVVKHLNGQHILMLGNYEWKDLDEKYGGDEDKFISVMIKCGFSQVITDNGMYFTIFCKNGEELKPFVTHCPENCYKNEFNLFAHIHGRQLVKRYGLDVGVDGHHFYPVSTENIFFFYNAIKKHYDHNVFE